MARRLTDAQQSEILRLRTACLAILDFVTARGNLEELASEFRIAVEDSFKRQNLKGLRMLRRDFHEWVRDLPPAARAQIEAVLSTIEEQAGDAELSTALDRGSILTDDEYRAVLTRVEEVHADPAAQGEVKRLNSMLTEFDRRIRTAN